MPFLAHREQQTGATQDLVAPEEVADGVDVFCPDCGGRMRPRGGSGKKARHFFHINNADSSCSGLGKGLGESEEHQVMKSLAVSGLRRRFGDTEIIEKCASEVSVDVEDTQSSVSVRRADALVEFKESNLFFGDGVIVEVQHGNEGKNIPEVSQDYLEAGYSVIWVFEDDFSGDRYRLDRFEAAFQDGDGIAFSPYLTEPDEIWELFDPRDWFNFPEGWQLDDPNPDCSHEFEHGRDEIECLLCDTLYRRHSESQLPIYSVQNEAGHPMETVYVRGEETSSKPDSSSHPHVHNWKRREGLDRTTKLSCREFGCTAKKIDGKTETVIDYTASEVDDLETREMKHCQHEWRRTGTGEECWKCGKPKPEDHGFNW